MVATLVVAAAVVTVVSVVTVNGDGDAAAPRVDGVTASSSSSAIGHAAVEAIARGTGQPPVGWRANRQTVGAWIELVWPMPRPIRSVTIERPALALPGVTGGYLAFADGSSVQVRLSSNSRSTTVPVTARLSRSVRFTASAVGAGAAATELTLFDVNRGGAAVTTDVLGSAGPAADVTQSPEGDPAALTDGSTSANGATWTQPSPVGSTLDFRWQRPRELVAIELTGADGSHATVRSATATFADGSVLRLGAVPADSTIPTTIAFMPRVTTSVRLTIDTVDGIGPLELAEVHIWERGATSAGTQPARGHGIVVDAPIASTCADVGADPTPPGIVVACPSVGSRVGDTQELVIRAGGYARIDVDVWPSAGDRTEPTVTVPASARTVVALKLGRLPVGPVTVRVSATGIGLEPAVARLQLLHGTPTAPDSRATPSAGGGTLVWDEEFDAPLSASRTGAGARYASAKPEATGVTEFGDAIFGDPAKGFGNVGVLDDRYLRLTAAALPAGESDPEGSGRTFVGGMLASARPGGSGFSAQYGRFEARMLVTAMPGTWPAFWLLPSTNLIQPQSVVAELDGIELYGHDPVGGCNSTHEYIRGKDGGIARCGQRFASEALAAQWHTYGVDVTPTSVVFTIDGRTVATAPQVQGGADPMFFLADFALGGGYPVDLAPAGGRAQVLVDWVRVYV